MAATPDTTVEVSGFCNIGVYYLLINTFSIPAPGMDHCRYRKYRSAAGSRQFLQAFSQTGI
jgi:hypothetical protein